MTMDRADIQTEVHRLLVENFEVDEADLGPEANLFEDLGMDSLDAIDMLLAMESFIGKSLDDEDKENAKKIRTIADVVDFVAHIDTRS